MIAERQGSSRLLQSLQRRRRGCAIELERLGRDAANGDEGQVIVLRATEMNVRLRVQRRGRQPVNLPAAPTAQSTFERRFYVFVPGTLAVRTGLRQGNHFRFRRHWRCIPAAGGWRGREQSVNGRQQGHRRNCWTIRRRHRGRGGADPDCGPGPRSRPSGNCGREPCRCLHPDLFHLGSVLEDQPRGRPIPIAVVCCRTRLDRGRQTTAAGGSDGGGMVCHEASRFDVANPGRQPPVLCPQN